MKLGREELIAKVKGYIGERTDDESISLIEDITDSFEESTDNSEEIDKLKSENEDLRRKYIERFTVSDLEKTGEEPVEMNSYDDLFNEEE